MIWSYLKSLFHKQTAKPEPEPVLETAQNINKVEEIMTQVDLNGEIVKEAIKYIGVRESGGANKGEDVEKFQKAVDGKAAGEPWCAAFCMYILKAVEDKHKNKSKVFKSEHVLTVWNKTDVSLKSSDPKPGCFIVWNYKGTASGHIGIVEAVTPSTIVTIEGNTGPDKTEVEREGDGVYRKRRSRNGTSKMVIKGYILPFPTTKATTIT